MTAEIKHIEACCPICGAGVKAYVMVGCVQKDGIWQLEEYPEESIQEALNDPNQEVECLNEFCGDPVDAFGNIIELKGKTEFEYWKAFQDPNLVPADAKLEDLSDDMQASFKNWSESLIYTPWHGVLGDCITLEGTKVADELHTLTS